MEIFFSYVLNPILKYRGKIIQVYVLLSIHLALIFELTSIEYYLLTFSKYERDFNYLTGFPLYFLVMFYYYKSCTQHPGKIRKNWDLYCRGDTYALKKCSKCENFKPIRTSHCKRCDVCVARRDHHCEFIDNCVGLTNYLSFFWFVVFGFLGSLHFIIRGIQWELEWFYGSRISMYSNYHAGAMMLHVYNMLGFAGFLGLVMVKTTRFTLSNLTVIDSWMIRCCFSDPEINVFDLGVVANWIAFFGTNPLLWFSPKTPTKFGVTIGPNFETRKLYD